MYIYNLHCFCFTLPLEECNARKLRGTCILIILISGINKNGFKHSFKVFSWPHKNTHTYLYEKTRMEGPLCIGEAQSGHWKGAGIRELCQPHYYLLKYKYFLKLIYIFFCFHSLMQCGLFMGLNDTSLWRAIWKATHLETITQKALPTPWHPECIWFDSVVLSQ